MAWGSHSEKEMIIGKVIFEISWKNDVHNNYETDYSTIVCLIIIVNIIFPHVAKMAKIILAKAWSGQV